MLAVSIATAEVVLPPIAILYNKAPELPAVTAPAAYQLAKILSATGPSGFNPTIKIVPGNILPPTTPPMVAPITSPFLSSLLLPVSLLSFS